MKNLKLSIPKTLNLLIYSFPLTFILGNFFINILVFFFSVFGIIYYKEKPFIINKYNPVNLIILFFAFLLFFTVIEYVRNDGISYFLKALLFLRYLIFLLIIRYMVLTNELNLKKTMMSFLIFSGFVAVDVIFQYFVGVNFFGNKPLHGFTTGVFGDEAIAGSYIQKFAIIGFFSIPLILNNKNYKLTYISIGFLAICFLGIFFSSNRMPTLMFAFFIFLIASFLFLRKFKIITTIFLIVIILSSAWMAGGIDKIENTITKKIENTRYGSFLVGIPSIFEIASELKKEYPEFEKYKNTGIKFWHTETFKINKDNIKILPAYTGHVQIYITALDIFGESPLIGRGIKSFRYTCLEKTHIPNRTCQNHPHHFYLEILNDTGIIGFFIIFASIILMTIKNFKKYYKKNKRFNKVFHFTFYAVFLSLIIELFPLRSHGSFFSVWNSAYIFFILGIFCGLYDLKSKKSIKKIFNF